MSRENVIVAQRIKPFITVNNKILKACREKDKWVLGINMPEVNKPELLLTYFTIMEMDASGVWLDDNDLENYKVSELSGLHIDTVIDCLRVLDALGVFK